MCFFFFSSRRRHTRSLCDWSSDVCSSDLLVVTTARGLEPAMAFYALLDRTPKGRDESASSPLWVRRHDEYARSEERRVGKECRSRGAPYHEKKNVGRGHGKQVARGQSNAL